MLDFQALTNRVNELDEDASLSLTQIFETVCVEFRLNSTELQEDLGCADPFAMIGFLAAEYEGD